MTSPDQVQQPGQAGNPARPYPVQYISRCVMKNGMPFTIRPIRPQDEPLMVRFHGTLSDRTVYLRYFGSLSLNRRVAHDRLAHICDCDYAHEMALVAEYHDPALNELRIVGVGRLNPLGDQPEAEIAVLISDQYQHIGLGTAILQRLLQVACDRKLTQVVAEMLRDNLAMQTLLKTLGFRLYSRDDPSSVRAVLQL